MSTAIISGSAQTISLTVTGQPSGVTTSSNPSSVTVGRQLDADDHGLEHGGGRHIHPVRQGHGDLGIPRGHAFADGDGVRRRRRRRRDRQRHLRGGESLRLDLHGRVGIGRQHRVPWRNLLREAGDQSRSDQRGQLHHPDVHGSGGRHRPDLLVQGDLPRLRHVRLGARDVERQHGGHDEHHPAEDLRHERLDPGQPRGPGRALLHVDPDEPRRQLHGRRDVHAVRRRRRDDPGASARWAHQRRLRVRPSPAGPPREPRRRS